MIKSIGYNKAIIIIVLAAFAGLAFFFKTQIIGPDLKKHQGNLSSTQSEISQMTTNLNDLTAGLERFEKQKEDFERVQRLGFFDPQNRVEARQRILAMQTESRLLSAKYSINPAESMTNDKLRKAGYKILNTNISFNLEALEDSDIYKFIYILNYGFPGQVKINNFSMEREQDVSVPLLQKIGVGQAEPLVSASLNVSWQTMVPDETISVNQEGQDGGAQQ